MTDNFYEKVDRANTVNIEIMVPGFKARDIPHGVPPNHKYAYGVRKVAFDLDFDNKAEWQHYWFKCCISDKCDYIFSILKSKDVDREDDLKKICNRESKLWKTRGNEEMQGYVDLCIDFFLKRYNWLDASKLWWENPPRKNLNFIKLLFPRLLGAILVGFIPIVTSKEIWEFAVVNQSNLLKYCAIIFVVSVFYLEYELYKTIRETVVKKWCQLRIIPVLLFGLFYSLLFSYIFTLVGFMGNVGWCWNRVIFYAMFAFLIGILIQLLWEEKTASEPL
ncbi:MAG: hypothetical protein GIS02_04480 [Methanosarcinales archaeon]|uniref:Uncharacterized protein n=1 Tax=Candidatus Ethanoperedens thermophilum TaxID=2766897 RepID=A0A848DBX5_9EURY|nr:hypothetical protein [Candidatus Ethanoperedens thermophilum]